MEKQNIEMNNCTIKDKKKTNKQTRMAVREKSSSFLTVHQEPMTGENPDADNSQGHAEGK